MNKISKVTVIKNKLNAIKKLHSRAVEEGLFDYRDLKVHEASFYAYDNNIDYNVFCEWTTCEFENFLDRVLEDVGISFRDLKQQIGRTSSFYYSTKSLNCCYMNNIELDDYYKKFDNFINYTFGECQLIESFKVVKGNIYIDDECNNKYILIDKISNHVLYDWISEELEEILKEFKEVLLDVRKLDNVIKQFKDNQVESFKSYIEGFIDVEIFNTKKECKEMINNKTYNSIKNLHSEAVKKGLFELKTLSVEKALQYQKSNSDKIVVANFYQWYTNEYTNFTHQIFNEVEETFYRMLTEEGKEFHYQVRSRLSLMPPLTPEYKNFDRFFDYCIERMEEPALDVIKEELLEWFKKLEIVDSLIEQFLNNQVTNFKHYLELAKEEGNFIERY